VDFAFDLSSQLSITSDGRRLTMNHATVVIAIDISKAHMSLSFATTRPTWKEAIAEELLSRALSGNLISSVLWARNQVAVAKE
jgi:CelD/BcsL family acetyltransferase involved in cellulose biosynthesis